MSLPTNTEIYNAIASVLNCRDSRRGRKPSLLLTIITGEDGKTVVTDHNTGCTQAIDKRSYKRSIKVKRKYTRRAPVGTTMMDTNGNVHFGTSTPNIRVNPNIGGTVTVKRGPGRPRKVVIVDGVAVMAATPTKAQIREAVDLCNKSDAVDAKANSALTDAQNLHAMLMNQKKALDGSTDPKDVTELRVINKRIASVELIIKGLGGK